MKTKYTIYLCCIFLSLLLFGCGTEEAPQGNKPVDTHDNIYNEITQSLPTPQLTEKDAERFMYPRRYAMDHEEIIEIQDKCQKIALLCDELMKNAETETQIYFPYDTTLTQNTIDDVEALLAEAGYSVLNTDSTYPSFIENSYGFEPFMDEVNNGKDTQQELLTVSSYSRINYSVFQYLDGAAYHLNAVIAWDENGDYSISEPYKEEVLDWGTTYGGYFYYQIYPMDPHWIAHISMRLQPTDKELFDLNAKYIQPIGYQCTNIFLIDWDSSNFNNMCFNDVFEFLYHMKYGERVDATAFEHSTDMNCALIPADIFESTILPHFDISLEEFRKATLYRADSNTYPWQTINCSNLTYFPALTTEVTEYRENADGTFTLVVDVLCFDAKCFPLFTHEVTIKPDSNGGFQYIANKLTYTTTEHSLPNAAPRLAEQRK